MSIIRTVLLLFILSICIIAGAFVNLWNNQKVDFSILEYSPGKPSILLDDEGKEWARFELDRREFTKFEQIPKHLIQAFIAAEDRDFFKHTGISPKGILRSIFINLRSGGIVQGASTITQQLVKLLYFDSKRTFKRKIKEQCFALLVERQFSKEQILELYLNHIYFGCGIYGVEAASQRFFGKAVSEISIGQAAVLASVVKSPANYCPLLCPLSAQKRRDLILGLMLQMNFITKEECDKQRAIELKIHSVDKKNIAPHLKETIRLFLEEKFGKEKVYRGGLVIQTTINSKMQDIAQQEFKKQFEKVKKEISSNADGALITIESKTGQIKALVGGFNFSNSKFNRALQAKRQVGSTFKPLVYAAALQNGVNLYDTDIDEPIEINGWKPNNNTRQFYGKMTLAKALSYSNNTIAVKTLLKAGCQNVIDLAKKFRFSAALKLYPSLALGCLDATLKESVAAFNVFVNNGTYVEPYYLKWIKDEWGTKICKFEPETEQVLSPIISSQIAKVLSLGMSRYIDRMDDKTFACASMGKTGTTNDSRTCWFCGATPTLTTSIYVGCDNNNSMGQNIYAVKTAFPIWFKMHQQIKPEKTTFSYDSRLKEACIDWVNGHITYPGSPNAVSILI